MAHSVRPGLENDNRLIHEWSVEDGSLAVGLPGHEDEPRPGVRVLHRESSARPEYRNLRTACALSVGPEAGVAFEER
jgi:hypothetical protein